MSVNVNVFVIDKIDNTLKYCHSNQHKDMVRGSFDALNIIGIYWL